MVWHLQRPLLAALVLTGAVVLLIGPGSEAADDDLWKVEKFDHKAYTEKVEGTYKDGTGKENKASLQFDMAPIPGGRYVMGSPATEKDRGEDEGPQHPVQIKPFWMGKCEVSWDEFDVYWKERGLAHKDDFTDLRKKDPDAITAPTPAYGNAGAPDYDHEHNGRPVICMTHHCAMEYCRWLSHKTGKHYRLPTEAEWEWAARCGTKTAYFFGDDPKELKQYAWFAENSPDKDHEDGTTHKPGTLKPNPWGLHDMYGNVMEWCVDHYKKDFYSECLKQKLTLNPVALPGPDRFGHVARGGSWSDEPAACRSAARRGSDKSWIKYDPQRPQSIWWLTRMDNLGFRVVRAVDEQENLKGIKSKVTLESR